MGVHIDELQSTVEIQHEDTLPTVPDAPDELTERARHQRYVRDRERLHAEGYAD